jgi:hypothetical protein
MFAGTVSAVREAMAELVSSAGISYLLCRFAFGGMAVEASLKTVELFVDEVMPALGVCRAGADP